jgi:hypothetical protein
MSAKGPGARSLEGPLNELYAAPFDRFVSLRKELAARLRAEGDAEAARRLGTANKPTRTAWALNQVARSHSELVDAIVDSWKAAAGAHNQDADAIRDGARRYREAIGEAVRAARAILAADGVSLSTAQARRMGETLQALAAHEVDREKLKAGRLTQDVSVDDPFGGLDPSHGVRHPKPLKAAGGQSSSRGAEEAAARKVEADRIRQEKQRAIDEARARVTSLEQSVAEARKMAADAERVRKQAESEAARAKRTVGTLEEDLARAREHLERLPK